MRLTLRTLLAYLDGVLAPDEADQVAEKIRKSEFASSIVDRLRQAQRNPRLEAPALAGKAMGIDPNMVAEYLDGVLPDDRVPEFERFCLARPGTHASEVQLAEVGGCHQILSQVLHGLPPVDAGARQRMYALAKSAAPPQRPTKVPEAVVAEFAIPDALTEWRPVSQQVPLSHQREESMEGTNGDLQLLLASLPRRPHQSPELRPEGPMGSDGITHATKVQFQVLYDRAQQLADARERIIEARPASLYVQRRALVAISLLFFVVGGLAGYGLKPGRQEELPPQEAPVLLIDLRTGKVFRQLDSQTDTEDDRRVARALWCPECRKWHPGPSSEAARNLPNGIAPCPVHPGIPLQTHE